MNILITGGTSGLGRAVTEKCTLQVGHHVYFTYSHNVSEAERLEEQYDNVTGVALNFDEVDSVEAFIEKIPDWDIDILVNNAYSGSPQGTYFVKTDVHEFVDSFERNVLPVIRITQACLSQFKKKRFGKIINVLTSSLIDLPPMGYSIYSANKAYIAQLSKCWCKEYARYNITSNCILPEYMSTHFAEVDERVVEQMRLNHPLKSLLRPEEVAEIIVTLMTTSQQLNGVCIPVNAAQHVM